MMKVNEENLINQIFRPTFEIVNSPFGNSGIRTVLHHYSKITISHFLIDS
jgi:hypothetical protein